MSQPKAVCLLSGGLDSATCLYYAKDQGYNPVALTFDYGQRHAKEQESARKLAQTLSIAHRQLRRDFF